MVRHCLTDDQWALIADLIPEPKKTGHPPVDRRTVVNGILWIMRTGAPWRDLPEDFGKWGTVWDLFDTWNSYGLLNEPGQRPVVIVRPRNQMQPLPRKPRHRVVQAAERCWSASMLPHRSQFVRRRSWHGAPAMGGTKETPIWEPTTEAERCTALDTIRGLALLGVLLVNLHSNFRVSLAEDLRGPPPSHRWGDRVVDRAVVVLLQFKAFALSSLLFGAGLAVFGERAAARAAGPTRFLARRLIILLALGLVHLLLVWNGDILTLYAVCGLLILPVCRLPAAALAAAGAAAFALPYIVPWGIGWPTEDILRKLAG